MDSVKFVIILLCKRGTFPRPFSIHRIKCRFSIVLFFLFLNKQVKFSPRRKQGFGLTDGEMLERLWSYIRRFAKMTKEMRPSHRTDVLTDALLHYGTKTVKKIGTFMFNLYNLGTTSQLN